MTAVNRTSWFNNTLPFIADGGRQHRINRGRLVTVTASPGGGGVGALYYMRGFDSGLSQWVTWGPFSYILLTPSSSQTTPNYTGSLSAINIALIPGA